VFPPVGHHLVIKSDEARFTLLARDMLRRGAWIAPEVEGQPYRNKPLLFPWIIAALSALGGAVTERTAQLPAAAAAVVAAVFTLRLGHRLFDRRVGFWAGLILATSASPFAHSQQILPDMLVLAFAVMSLCAFWVAMSTASPPALVGFYAALGFCVFAKGPVGLLPLLIAGVWLLTEDGARGLRRLWSPAGIGVFVVVTLTWLAPFLREGSRSFGEHVLWEDWLVNYLSLPQPHRILGFVGDALVGFLPWSVVLPLALGHAVRQRRDAAVRFVLLCVAVPLLLIILSRTRLPRYLLPVYPGCAVLVAWWAAAHGAVPTPLGRVLGWASFLGIAVAAAFLPRFLTIADASIPLDAELAVRAIPVLVCAVLMGAIALVGLRDGRPALLVVGGAATMAVLLGYGVWLANGWTDRTEDFRAVAATVRRLAPDGDLRVFTQAKLLPMDFYYGRELPRIATVSELRAYLAASASPTVLIDEQDLRVTPPDLIRDLRVLAALRIHEQRLFILGCRPREGATGTGCVRSSSSERPARRVAALTEPVAR
jgi:4-amino-4-deoxy-L-arabinose transferase-like glycosyltransferase